MISTNISKNNDRGFDLTIDGSSLYDLTLDTNLTDIDMNSIYHKTLSNHCLVVDSNVSGGTFNYIRNVEDYSVVDSLVPASDIPASYYHQYQFIGDDYKMFEERNELGWTAEFILNFDLSTPAPPQEDVLFYMGKTMNLSGDTADFVDNNFLITLKNRTLVFKQIQYQKECECDDPSDVVNKNIYKSQITLPTGTSLHHLVVVFERNLKFSEEELKYKGAAYDCDIPSNRWYDGKKFRMGNLKIYIDGILKETFPWEEIIFRNTSNLLPFVQGWGLGDETTYELSVDYGVAGSYTGNIIRGRFYECPLKGFEIKTNFEIFSDEYNITNIFTSC